MMYCTPPGYIIFSLRKLKFYEGRIWGPDKPKTRNKELCNIFAKNSKKTKQNKTICKQTGVSTLTVKRMQGENDADIKEHLFCCHLSCFGNFFIFSTALRWGSLSKKISKKRYHLDKNYCYFCKSNIPVVNLTVGSENKIKLWKNMSL